MSMKLKNLLNENITVDVGSSYSDDWCICFVGSVKLTNAGLKRFAPILDNYVRTNVFPGFYEVICENDFEDRLARKLFTYLAGYCSDYTYNTYFKD